MMRKAMRPVLTVVICGVPFVAAFAAPPDAPPASGNRTPPPLIGTHQIDRYSAIDQVRKTLEENPKSLSDWVILGELAHEVAIDAPPDQAARYYQMSREAYEKALALAPNNPGLKAAARFARDQEEGAARFDKERGSATRTYLEARRRDLAATNYTPAVRVYAPPAPAAAVPSNPNAPAEPVTTTTTAPVTTTTEATVAAPTAAVPTPPVATTTAQPAAVVTNDTYGVRQFYTPYPVYQPYWTDGTATPYTYQQYSSAYYPPNYYTNPAYQPMTIQRWTQQLPSALLNSTGRAILRGGRLP